MAKRSEYLQTHNESNLSFWYFRNQIVGSLTTLYPKDDSIFRFLRIIYENSFSQHYNSTLEGKVLYNKLINDSLKLGDRAPAIQFEDILDKTIYSSLTDKRMIVIEFWASWCVPCMQKIPFINTIREKYDSSKLTIIGVSIDYDQKLAMKAIDRHGMLWKTCFDDDFTVKSNFNIYAIPVTVLIDKDKYIFYNSQIEDDNSKLLSILESNLGK